jgi:deoxyribose-phosphate aldolase
MKKSIPVSMGVKASGGIRSAQIAWQLIEAGAQRLGTSSGVQLIAASSGESKEITGY